MRKKLTTTGLFLFMSFTCFTQSFLSNDKQWNVRLNSFGISTEVFKIEGDTIINSVPYQKIWVSYDSLMTWVFMGSVRENENIVYYLHPDYSEGVLYDFTLEAGDTAWVRNYFCDEVVPVYVIGVDTVEYFGVSRKRWHLGGNDYSVEHWIEGIGSLWGPLYTRFDYCIICPVWELLCYHESDTLLYILPGENECYQQTVGIDENPVQNEIAISSNPALTGNPVRISGLPATIDEPAIIEVFDLTGRRLISAATKQTDFILNAPEKQGVYFVIVSNSTCKTTLKMVIK